MKNFERITKIKEHDDVFEQISTYEKNRFFFRFLHEFEFYWKRRWYRTYCKTWRRTNELKFRELKKKYFDFWLLKHLKLCNRRKFSSFHRFLYQQYRNDKVKYTRTNEIFVQHIVHVLFYHRDLISIKFVNFFRKNLCVWL